MARAGHRHRPGQAARCAVRLALADDPPATIELTNAEGLTRCEVVDAFERAYGTTFRRVSVPRPVLATGARLLRRANPVMASVLGMSLSMDVDGLPADASARGHVRPQLEIDAQQQVHRPESAWSAPPLN